MEVIMKLKPLDDRLVIEPMVGTEQNVGGIIIPDTAKEKPNIGSVIAVGNDEELQELVKVGDKVLYSKYGGTEVDVEDKKYLIISRSDVLALVEQQYALHRIDWREFPERSEKCKHGKYFVKYLNEEPTWREIFDNVK